MFGFWLHDLKGLLCTRMIFYTTAISIKLSHFLFCTHNHPSVGIKARESDQMYNQQKNMNAMVLALQWPVIHCSPNNTFNIDIVINDGAIIINIQLFSFALQ